MTEPKKEGLGTDDDSNVITRHRCTSIELLKVKFRNESLNMVDLCVANELE